MNELILNLQAVPYVRGGSDWSGGDCWFVVEAWYLKRFGITLPDRGDIAPGPEGILEGFNNITNWVPVEEPENDDLVIMSSIVDRQKITAGHCGIYWNHGVLHSDDKIGCVYQPITSRRLKSRVTSYLRYVHFV